MNTEHSMLEEESAFTGDWKNTLIEWFTQYPVPHGQRFDNQKRWCELCQESMSVRRSAQHETECTACPVCKSLWPEFVDIAAALSDDSDFFENDLIFVTLH